MKNVITALVFGMGLFLIAHAMALMVPLDDTDNKATGKRSDMEILIDHGTGCQYLSRFGLTPRLDANGKPMCKGA